MPRSIDELALTDAEIDLIKEQWETDPKAIMISLDPAIYGESFFDLANMLRGDQTLWGVHPVDWFGIRSYGGALNEFCRFYFRDKNRALMFKLSVTSDG